MVVATARSSRTCCAVTTSMASGTTASPLALLESSVLFICAKETEKLQGQSVEIRAHFRKQVMAGHLAGENMELTARYLFAYFTPVPRWHLPVHFTRRDQSGTAI